MAVAAQALAMALAMGQVMAVAMALAMALAMGQVMVVATVQELQQKCNHQALRISLKS